MTEPNRATEQPATTVTKKQALDAVKISARRDMAKVDYLPGYVEGLLQNAQLMTAIFNEKTKRQAAADEAAGIPKEKRALPDLAELKMVIDANEKAVKADIALRDEHRKAIQWMMMTAPRKPRSIDFGKPTKKAPAVPAVAND